jgi:hypothetical protein
VYTGALVGAPLGGAAATFGGYVYTGAGGGVPIERVIEPSGIAAGNANASGAEGNGSGADVSTTHIEATAAPTNAADNPRLITDGGEDAGVGGGGRR